MSKLIYVPQGCYAEMKDKQYTDVLGLVASGIGPCCHVIVANKSTRYMILCHADAATDLTSPVHGVLAWIQRVCPDNDYTKLMIDMGEDELHHRDYSADFYHQVNNVLASNNIDARPTLSVAEAGQYGIFISKETAEINEVSHDKLNLAAELKEAGNQLIELQDLEGNLLEGDIIRARTYASDNRGETDSSTQLKFPPICVFNGESEDFLTIEQISHNSQGFGINWERVRNHAPSQDPTPPSSQASHSENEYQSDFEKASEDSARASIARKRSSSSGGIEDFAKISRPSFSSIRNSLDAKEIEEELTIAPHQGSANVEKSPEASEISDESTHLVRSEKAHFTQPANFIDTLCEGLSEGAKAKIVNMREEVSFWSKPSTFSSNIMNAQPKITLLAENNHEIDHKTNIQKLIQTIEGGKIKANTVICLERKEEGSNFGMQDVILLANILEHNKSAPQETILISNKIQNSPIYQDAILYNVAKLYGVEIIGIEGKGLEHGKESSEHNSIREAHMAKHIEEITATGKNVIFSVGTTHIDGLKTRLPSAHASTAESSSAKTNNDFCSRVLASKASSQSFAR